MTNRDPNKPQDKRTLRGALVSFWEWMGSEAADDLKHDIVDGMEDAVETLCRLVGALVLYVCLLLLFSGYDLSVLLAVVADGMKYRPPFQQ